MGSIMKQDEKLVEIVAEALCIAAGKDCPAERFDIHDKMANAVIPLVQAALLREMLEAEEEPFVEEMCRAAWGCSNAWATPESNPGEDGFAPYAVFRAMLHEFVTSKRLEIE